MLLAVSCNRETQYIINHFSIEGTDSRTIIDTVGASSGDDKVIDFIYKFDSVFNYRDSIRVDKFHISYKVKDLADSITLYSTEFNNGSFATDYQMITYKGRILYFKNSASYDIYRLMKTLVCSSGKCTDIDFRLINKEIDNYIKISQPTPVSIDADNEFPDSIKIEL